MTVHALVAGAGYVGGVLATRLLARDERVTVLRRSETPPPPGADALPADLAVPRGLEALSDVDVAYFLLSADERSEAAYRRAYVTAIANLVERLVKQARPPRRLLYVSSTGVYGQRGGEWVDESSPTEPLDFSGRLLLEGEAIAGGAPFPTTVVRLGGIYGPGRTSLMERVRSGKARTSGRFTNRIHRDDAAAALAHLGALEEAPPVVVGVDSAPVRDTEVLGWLAEALGVPAPEAAAPPREGRRATNKRCSNARLLGTGVRLGYPTYREGYRALLAGSSR